MTSTNAHLITQVGGVAFDLGQPVHPTWKKQLQQRVNAIIGWTEIDRAPLTIRQPFLRGLEQHLLEHRYYVCEKSVGIRYIVVLLQGHCYLISQNYDIREVPLFCPVRPDRVQAGIDRNTIVPHQWTILDGLLVCDKDGNKFTLALQIYDILALNGVPKLALKLPDRLKLIQNDVIGPRKTIPPPKNAPSDIFQLVLPPMYPINRVSHVIRNIIPRISQTRQNEGLVFISMTQPYTCGYTNDMYTWTSLGLRTVAFQLSCEWRGSPPMPGFKLMVHEKRTQKFHDWITLPTDTFEYFRMDKKASSRIIECIYDPQWYTFIPSQDKTSWNHGDPEISDPERGIGWRLGGWKYIRSRPDIGMPMEREVVLLVEKAIQDDVKMEELEQLFPVDESYAMKSTNKPMNMNTGGLSIAPSTSGSSTSLPSTLDNTDVVMMGKKKIRNNVNNGNPMLNSNNGMNGGSTQGGSSTGVCYDFQNKGQCNRGRYCHFSHCACNSTCSCTPTNNTYGQRPSYRRNDYDTPSSPDNSTSIIGNALSNSLANSSVLLSGKTTTSPFNTNASTDDQELDEGHIDEHGESEAGELMDHHHYIHLGLSGLSPHTNGSTNRMNPKSYYPTQLHLRQIYAPLENFEPETIAAKQAQITMLSNRRIYASLGLLDKDDGPARKRHCGLFVSKTGEITNVRIKDN